MILAISFAALAFLGQQALIQKFARAEYGAAFKMSRGLAALVLTALGLAGLWGARAHWKVGFLYEHEPGDWMLWGVTTAYGHLIADMLSMGWAAGVRKEPPRLDLVLHHVLGLLAYGVSLSLGIGHALVLISLASEVMPCCTGLEAWGRHLKRPAWILAAARLRLRVLVWWRLPLWAGVLFVLVRARWTGTLSEQMQPLSLFVLVCLSGLVALDIYWVRKCVDAARREEQQARGVEG